MSQQPARAEDLFKRPDGQPYRFWIQSDLAPSLIEDLERAIEEHGGEVIHEKGVFPDHGFLLIDPWSWHTLYEIKTVYHKPIKQDSSTLRFVRGNRARPTPLRHVLCYRFVEAVVAKGQWDSHDLLRWGWPVELSKEDLKNAEKMAKKYSKEVQDLGDDEEMEKGWIWAINNIFNPCDSTYKFTEEIAEMERLHPELITLKKGTDEDRFTAKAVEGVAVQMTKTIRSKRFYLHSDIEDVEERRVVRLIMENGGATCYDISEADVILIGSSMEEVEDDPEIREWISRRDRSSGAADVKFVGWVAACVQAGSVEEVDREVEDAVIAFQAYQQAQKRRKAKGKEVIRAPPPTITSAKRKRPAEESNEVIDLDSSPVKRRKLDQANGSASGRVPPNGSSARHSVFSKLNNSATEHGSGSTVRPNKTYAGVALPATQPSPLSRGQRASSLKRASTRPSATTEMVDEEDESLVLDPNDIIEIPPTDSPDTAYDPLKVRAPRLSALSAITSGTAASSKVGNTTTTTSTSNATKSARSVGPNLEPSNAKQAPRPSTSTSISGASRGALERSIQPNKPISFARTNSIRESNFDADDLAAEKLLSSFEQAYPVANDFELPSPSSFAKAPKVANTSVTAVERKVLCWFRLMVEENDRKGLTSIAESMKDWLQQRYQNDAANATRKLKGKGRVSFPDDERIKRASQAVEPTTKTSATRNAMQKVSPVNRSRMVSRARQSSRTPSSLGQASEDEESSYHPDEEAKEEEVEEEHEEAESTRKLRSTRSSSKGSGVKDSRRTKEVPPDVFGPVKFSTLQQPTTKSRSVLEKKTVEPDEEEEDDKVAPLPFPVPKKRTQKKRAGSVTSDAETDGETFKPRRGRSASAAPSDTPATTRGTATARGKPLSKAISTRRR